MKEIQIDGLAKFKNIKLTFASPAELNPLKPFPKAELDDGELEFASLSAGGDQEFPIGKSGDVKFKIGGAVTAAFGVYSDPKVLLGKLKTDGLSDQLANLLNLKLAENENLMAMRLGFNFAAGVNGKIGLFSLGSPVNLTFGVDGRTEGLSVLLHSTSADKSVKDSIAETLESWTTPRQVKTADDLEPKTTVIFETLGKLDVNLGVNYGYEFSWVRESLKLGGLSGDLGLKIELGIAAKFGFNTVGNYALALSRESAEKTVRLQVFKLNQKGWSFAFDGGFEAQAHTTLLPNSLDEFIKGVFNLNGSQVLKDFEKWMDPNAKLSDLLGKELEAQADKLVRELTGLSASEAIEKGMKKVKDAIKKWHALPHDATAYLYGLLGKSGDLDKLKEFLNRAKSLSGSPEEVVKEIESHLEDFEFYKNPVVKLLMPFAEGGILSLLANFSDKQAEFGKYVDKALGILDGGTVEKILTNLKKEVDSRFDLDKIANSNPDEWLRKRLTDFLGSSEIVKDLDRIRGVVIDLRKKADEFYKKGYEALLRKYSFSINYAFQKSTAGNALIDVTFDFDKNAAQSKKLLAEALDGTFANVLTDKKLDFLKVNKAVLTHEINRSVHLGVNLAGFERGLDHFTKSIAEGKVVETAEDKMWVFTLNAEDIVKKKKSVSRLAIAAELSEKSGVRTFAEENNTLDYSFAYGKSKVDSRYIEQRFETAANTYLGSEFPAANGGFRKYLFELDEQLDSRGFPKPDEFGNVLASLKVSVPGSILSVWEKVPADTTDDFYKELSGVVQTAFREWIPLNYIDSPEKYVDEIEDDIYPLLVYSCLPILNDKQNEKEKFKRAFYWDYKDKARREAIFKDQNFQERLRKTLEEVSKVVSEPFKSRFAASEIPNIIKLKKGIGNFKELCRFEENLLEKISETINAYLDFRTESEPAKKIEKLAVFGGKFTDTFNDEIGGIGYTPKGALRPLGLLLFLRIARLLKKGFDESKMAAMFELLVLSAETDDDTYNDARKRYFEGEYPTEEDRKGIVLQQRIVNTSSLVLKN